MQPLFRRLAVFVGGWTLEAAETICNLDGDLPMTVLDGLATLVDQSLVQQTEIDGPPRFRMLETIREYALDQLAASGEEDTIRQLHASYFLELTEAAAPMLRSARRPAWLERLEADHDNLRAVLAWSRMVKDNSEMQLRLTAALWPFWFFRGYASEGRSWLEDAIARTSALAAVPARAWVLCGAGALAGYQSDYATARAWLEQSVANFRALEDRRGLAYALTHLGWTAQHQDDMVAARAAQEESMAHFQEVGDHWGLALAMSHMAEIPLFQYDYAVARALYEKAATLFRELGDRWGLGKALAGQGFVAHEQGDDTAARLLFEESVPMMREAGDTVWLAVLLNKQGEVLRCQDDYETAVTCYSESLESGSCIGQQNGDR